jgi:hypothetical protein
MTKTSELENKLSEHRNDLLKSVHRVANCLALPVTLRSCPNCVDKSLCRKISDVIW